jgi:hypothetical protein
MFGISCRSISLCLMSCILRSPHSAYNNIQRHSRKIIYKDFDICGQYFVNLNLSMYDTTYMISPILKMTGDTMYTMLLASLHFIEGI